MGSRTNIKAFKKRKKNDIVLYAVDCKDEVVNETNFNYFTY